MKKMNIELKLKTERRNLIIRRSIYFPLAALAFVFMTTAKLPFHTPLLLVSMAVCTGIFENDSPVYCAVCGCACGLLTDIATGTLISFNGIILGLCSMMTSLFFLFFFRRKFINFLIMDMAVTLVQGLLHYLFFYLLWGYDKSGGIFTDYFIPEFIVTNIAGIAVYGIFLLISRFLGTVREHYIEE